MHWQTWKLSRNQSGTPFYLDSFLDFGKLYRLDGMELLQVFEPKHSTSNSTFRQPSPFKIRYRFPIFQLLKVAQANALAHLTADKSVS